MDEQNIISFLSVLGEEFCETLSPVVGWDSVVPQDAYEVFYCTFNQEPNPQMLALLSETECARLHAQCEEYFECQSITVHHICSIVSGALARWSIDP